MTSRTAWGAKTIPLGPLLLNEDNNFSLPGLTICLLHPSDQLFFVLEDIDEYHEAGSQQLMLIKHMHFHKVACWFVPYNYFYTLNRHIV